MKWRLKAVIFFFYLVMYALVALAVHIAVRNLRSKRRIILRVMRFWSKRAVNLFGVKLKIEGEVPHIYSQPNHLVVGNHMSYLDILISASVCPSVYITSMEMRDSKLIGEVSKLASAIFIERRDRSNVENEIKDIENHLEMGFNVGLYPEGTTTNGSEILKFKRTFFDPAINTKKSVLPVCLKYTAIDGETFSERNADKVCWYGKMEFAPHLMDLLKLDRIDVTMSYLPEISIRDDHDRRSLADECRTVINYRYQELSTSMPELVRQGRACYIPWNMRDRRTTSV